MRPHCRESNSRPGPPRQPWPTYHLLRFLNTEGKTMAEKKQESFIVTDRRLFTSEGELRKEVSEEEVSSAPPSPPPTKELEMTFERFMASLYMTAMLQLGLMQEEGGKPRLDLIGARQTIDTLSLLSEKTKGNLTAAEENFLQNVLYEL